MRPMDEDQPTHAMIADPLVGRVLDGRYRIIRRLATGGMGQVYLGEQQGLARTVAVKVLTTPPTEPEATEFRERFFKEARLCSRLTHPNTVRIYDFGHTSDGVYYIAMEYLDGATLTMLLRDGALDPLRAIALALQVCASLSEAHALGMIHRDLKPDNLIVTRHADGREFVRVVDFGIAKDMLSDAPTQAGTLFGSPGYMSPEQILEQEVTTASDIYSLGAIFYRMLTGRKPYDQSSPMAIINRQVNAAPPSFSESNPDIDVPWSLEWVTMRAMEKEPSDRFGSAAELARALRACDLELRGMLPHPDLRLIDGRLVLPPAAEEQLRRFDAGGVTNTGSPSPVRRPVDATMDRDPPSSSRSVSQRLRRPVFLVLGGLIPLMAGAGAVVVGMVVVWLLLVGLGNRNTAGGPPATSVAPPPAPAAIEEPAPVEEAPPAAPVAAPEPAPEAPERGSPARPRRPKPAAEPVAVVDPAPAPAPPPPAPTTTDPTGRNDLKDPFED
jgi:eukaryotic-like serine/threonine-protein kinase